MTREDALELMLKSSINIPEGSHWIDAAQELAEVIENNNRISEEEVATLIGVGALLARQGRREFEAGVNFERFYKNIRKE